MTKSTQGEAPLISLQLLTPARLLYKASLSHVQVPLHDGLAGFLPSHAPLLALLGYGLLSCKTESCTRKFVIEGGFMKFAGGLLSIMAKRAEALEDLDYEQAQRAFEKARHSPAKGEEAILLRLQSLAAARVRLKHAPKP